MPSYSNSLDPNDPNSPSYNTFSATALTTGISWQHGSALPPDFKVNIRSNKTYGSYSSYKVVLSYNVYNVQNEIIRFSDGTNDIEFFTNPSVLFQKSVYAGFKNLQVLSEGYYDCELYFTLYGISGGMETYLDTSSILFSLTVTGQPETITTDKTVYNVIFNRQTNELTGDLQVLVQGNVNNASLVFFNNLEVFKNVDPISGNNFALEPKAPLSGNTLLPTEGEYEVSALIRKNVTGGSPVTVYSFVIRIFVLNGDLMINRDDLGFSLIKSAGEVKSEVIKVINPLGKAFTIEGPYWLEFSAAGGNTSADITVSTLNSSTLPVGNLTGNVLIKWDSKTKTIPVTLSVISFVFLAGMEAYNFCLDDKVISFIRQTDSARYVRSTLTVKMASRDTQTTFVTPLVVPYYNGRASFDLGQKVHQYFLRVKKSILRDAKVPSVLDNQLWLKPAEVSILLEELDVDYNVVHSENVAAIQFYPGKKPTAFPMLSNNLYRQRVEGSKYIFSYIQGLVNPAKIGIGTPNALENGIISSLKIEDDENKIIFPKKKTIEVVPGKVLTYFTLPSVGPNLIHIQYQNQNLCPEAFTFTGHLKKNPDYTHIYDQNVLTSIKEKYDVTKVVSWTINTGFVSGVCKDIIDEIEDSLLCFIEFRGKVYRGFCISQKLTLEDTSVDLFQYDLDFLIVDNGN